MSENNQVDDLIAFGKNARNILDDATFKAVIQSVKDDIHISWKQTSPHEAKERERYYQLLQAIDLLEENIDLYVKQQKKLQPKWYNNKIIWFSSGILTTVLTGKLIVGAIN